MVIHIGYFRLLFDGQSLFDKVCVDGLLSESGDSGATMMIRAPAVLVPAATKSRRGSDDDNDDDVLPVWEIYNANKLLALSSTLFGDVSGQGK